MKRPKCVNAVLILLLLLSSIVVVSTVVVSSDARAQSGADSDDLARFVAVMQYIRSQPTPTDVDQDLLAAFFDLLDTRLSDWTPGSPKFT